LRILKLTRSNFLNIFLENYLNSELLEIRLQAKKKSSKVTKFSLLVKKNTKKK